MWVNGQFILTISVLQLSTFALLQRDQRIEIPLIEYAYRDMANFAILQRIRIPLIEYACRDMQILQ